MLAPDINTTESGMQSSINAAQAVTQYAQALATLVPAYFYALTGNWKSLQPTLQHVIDNAQVWPNSLCGPYTQGIPTSFISYNDCFQKSVGTLLQQETILSKDPTNAAAKTALTTGLQTLQQQLQNLSKPLSDLEPSIISYQNTLQNDHNTIDAIVGDLARSLPDGNTVIDSVQSSLDVTFFSCSVLGPCSAIVEMKSSIAVQLRIALQTAPPVVPTVLVQSLLEQMEPENEAATNALTQILEVWNTMNVKLQAVINQIEQAQASQMGDILQELALQDTALSWQQLATYAQNLLSPSQIEEPFFA